MVWDCAVFVVHKSRQIPCPEKEHSLPLPSKYSSLKGAVYNSMDSGEKEEITRNKKCIKRAHSIGKWTICREEPVIKLFFPLCLHSTLGSCPSRFIGLWNVLTVADGVSITTEGKGHLPTIKHLFNYTLPSKKNLVQEAGDRLLLELPLLTDMNGPRPGNPAHSKHDSEFTTHSRRLVFCMNSSLSKSGRTTVRKNSCLSAAGQLWSVFRIPAHCVDHDSLKNSHH